MPIHIPIKKIGIEQPITVHSSIVDGLYEWCNHAGAEDVEICLDPGGDFEQIATAPECDKCHAIQNIVGEWS